MTELAVNKNDCDLDAALAGISGGAVQRVTIDLTKIGWFNPIDIVRFKCLLQLAHEHSVTAKVIPPSKIEAANYARRMGLLPSSKGVPSVAGATFFPLYEVRGDSNSALFDELVRVFGPEQPSVNWAPEVAAALIELADNIFYHAGTTLSSGWGYAHAQKLPNAKKIAVGIADAGIGYTASYRRTGQDRGRSPKQIVEDSFKLQESSLNLPGKPPHRGIGLFSVNDFISGFEGTLRLCTDNVSAEIVGKSPLRVGELPYYVCGTWVSLEIPIQ